MPTTILGISITGTTVHAVEMQKSGLYGVLRAIDEWENPFPPGVQEPGPQEIDLFADQLAAFMKAGKIAAAEISVALDTASLFIHRVPIEENASDTAIAQQTGWELTQYFPDLSPTDFIVDYHRMSRFPSIRLNEILAVAVRRSLAQAIGKAAKGLGLRLRVLDADHFAAESALRVNYPDALRRQVVLIGVKKTRIDISHLKNGNLETFRGISVDAEEEIIAEIGALSRESAGGFTIVVYGPGLNADLLQGIRKNSATLVEALNPLRHVSIASSLRVADHLTTPSYRFASVIGLALRRD